MTTFTATSTKSVTVDTFAEAVAEESVKFHTVRANGTTRRIRVLKGEDLEVAEWIIEQREDGRTMKDIAKEMSVSVPTVRRMINRYLLTEEVLEAEQDEVAEWVELAEANREAIEEAKAEQQPEAEVAEEEAETGSTTDEVEATKAN